MALLLLLLTALVPCLLGMGALRVFYGGRNAQEMSLPDCVLNGGIIVIGLAEAANLAAVMLGWSFSRCVKVFWIGLAVCCVAAVVVLVVARRRGMELGKRSKILQNKALAVRNLPWLLFALTAVMQVIYVGTMQGVSVDGDMTLESVNSFLDSDRVYEINPLTGNAYTLGMPVRLKVLCLPTLYGILSQSFGIGAELLVYGIVPMTVLVGSFLSYSILAKYIIWN